MCQLQKLRLCRVHDLSLLPSQTMKKWILKKNWKATNLKQNGIKWNTRKENTLALQDERKYKHRDVVSKNKDLSYSKFQ